MLRRKRGTQEAQAQEDAADDFDDEETFLNLDDTLQGRAVSLTAASWGSGGCHTC
jgi:hypothetical protein